MTKDNKRKFDWDIYLWLFGSIGLMLFGSFLLINSWVIGLALMVFGFATLIGGVCFD
jgi:hypothetical protein